MQTLYPHSTSLVVVDLQKGFSELCPNELPIPGTTKIVPNVNRLLAEYWARIDASVDWHPPDHRSFLGQRDNLYPPHCVAGTFGAEFLPDLLVERFQVIWRKGFQQDFEAYAVTAQHPGLFQLYAAENIDTVVICGLATNICCFFAAKDFLNAGFRVILVEDASAGIDIPHANLWQLEAKKEGETLGIEYVLTDEIVVNRKC